MSPVNVVEHPVVGSCLRTLRNRDTQAEEFRRAMKKLGLLLAVESTRDLEVTEGTVVTPLGVEARCSYVNDGRVLLIPILRAGLGFVDGFLEVLPGAKVAHIGVSRNHDTLEAKKYLDSVPTRPGEFDRVLVLDPMLATGNSSVAALDIIAGKGYPPGCITLVCAFAVKPGIEQVRKRFPEVRIITAVIDRELNEKAYIVPGLGDAGDRLFLL